jgi:hypothetical protein
MQLKRPLWINKTTPMKKITYLYFIFFSTVISLSSSTNPIVDKTEKYDNLLKLKAETSSFKKLNVS